MMKLLIHNYANDRVMDKSPITLKNNGPLRHGAQPILARPSGLGGLFFLSEIA